ncbi:MAG: quinone oxidoreductase [Acidobacteriaceae bacterium]|nr:quinone oxidoreductase [Acidobacteriaceae bacterium]
MKAIQILKTGGPEQLVLREVAEPVLFSGDVLVQVKAAGVNFIDVYFREGRYPAVLPFVPGQEGAGVVLKVGAGVEKVQAGQRVAWCGVQGSYAEKAVVPAQMLVTIPEHLSFEVAAAAMLQGMTAHYLAHSTYAIGKGDDVLIHAGAGGVGLLLTQMAKMLGARVLTTVSSDGKAKISQAAGADEVIEYTKMDFATEVKRLTGGKGVHVVYDGVGKDTFDGSLASLRPRGMLALFGGASGVVPPFDLIKLSQMGSLFITRPSLKDYIADRAELEWRAGDVLGWIAEKKLKLRVEHMYPLAEARQAHEDLQGRKTTGKLILTV